MQQRTRRPAVWATSSSEPCVSWCWVGAHLRALTMLSYLPLSLNLDSASAVTLALKVTQQHYSQEHSLTFSTVNIDPYVLTLRSWCFPLGLTCLQDTMWLTTSRLSPVLIHCHCLSRPWFVWIFMCHFTSDVKRETLPRCCNRPSN